MDLVQHSPLWFLSGQEENGQQSQEVVTTPTGLLLQKTWVAGPHQEVTRALLSHYIPTQFPQPGIYAFIFNPNPQGSEALMTPGKLSLPPQKTTALGK